MCLQHCVRLSRCGNYTYTVAPANIARRPIYSAASRQNIKHASPSNYQVIAVLRALSVVSGAIRQGPTRSMSRSRAPAANNRSPNDVRRMVRA